MTTNKKETIVKVNLSKEENNVAEYINALAEQLRKDTDRVRGNMIIDDILEVQGGKYKSYKEYVESKEQIIAKIEELNYKNYQEVIARKGTSAELAMGYTPLPLQITEEQFNYIMERKDVE